MLNSTIEYPQIETLGYTYKLVRLRLICCLIHRVILGNLLGYTHTIPQYLILYQGEFT